MYSIMLNIEHMYEMVNLSKFCNLDVCIRLGDYNNVVDMNICVGSLHHIEDIDTCLDKEFLYSPCDMGKYWNEKWDIPVYICNVVHYKTFTVNYSILKIILKNWMLFFLFISVYYIQYFINFHIWFNKKNKTKIYLQWFGKGTHPKNEHRN